MDTDTFNQSDSVGVAFLGRGFASSFHIENYRRVHGTRVRLVGVHSRDFEASRKFAEERGLEKSYRELQEMLEIVQM